jgi:hypothetical protein
MKEEIFISTMGIFLIFNTFYYLMEGSVSSLLVGGISSMLLIISTAVATVLLLGVDATILGFGISLSDSSVKIVFVTLILINVLFKIEIAGFSVGLGLATTLANAFNGGDFLGLGTVLSAMLSFMALFSGIMIVSEDS